MRGSTAAATPASAPSWRGAARGLLSCVVAAAPSLWDASGATERKKGLFEGALRRMKSAALAE